MKTVRLKVDPDSLTSSLSLEAIDQAASILRKGGLVAFPTETVYGLGANALSAKSVEGIFLAKQRPAWDPVIVHISDPEMLSPILAGNQLTHSATQLMAAFWPGPLTLLLPKADAVPAIVTAGRPLVGVRMPAHPVAHALIAAASLPIAAPSANRFGRVSPTLADHVLEDLDGRIDAVLDAGETAHGLESTVVDASVEPVTVYRMGVITIQQIRSACGTAVEWKPEANSQPATPESLPSPGVGIRHYAPRARLILVPDEPPSQASAFAQAVEEALRSKQRIGIMLPTNFLSDVILPTDNRVEIFHWGEWQSLPELAHRLFAGLRQLDAVGVLTILCPLPPAVGIGAAICDRLLKAARSE